MSDPQNQVKTLVDTHGIRAVADHLGVSFESLKSIYAGLHVRAGTMALVVSNLSKPFLLTNGLAKKKAPAKKKTAKKKAAKK